MDEYCKHDCTQCKYKRDCKDYKIVPIRKYYGVQYMCVPGKKCKGFKDVNFKQQPQYIENETTKAVSDSG